MTVETEVRRILQEDADATTWSFKIDDVIGGESLADVVSMMDAKPRRTSPLVLSAVAAGVVSMMGIGSYVVSHRDDAKVVSKAAPTTAAVPVTTPAPPVTAVAVVPSQVTTTAAPAAATPTPAPAEPAIASGSFQGESWEARKSGDCWTVSFGGGGTQTVCGNATNGSGFVGLSVLQNEHRFVVAVLGGDVGKVQAVYADGRTEDVVPVAPGLVLLGVDAADTLVSLNALSAGGQPVTEVGGEITGNTSSTINIGTITGAGGATSSTSVSTSSSSGSGSAQATVSVTNGDGTTSTQIIVSDSGVSASASASASGTGSVSASSSASASSSGSASVSVPPVSIPDITIPDISIPDISVPDISIPKR